LKPEIEGNHKLAQKSPLTRGRGLKPEIEGNHKLAQKSPLTRGRGVTDWILWQRFSALRPRSLMA